MTKCVITGCKNEGIRNCTLMVGLSNYDLFCDECHPMIEIMYLAQDSRRLPTNPSPRQINKYIDDMIEQAQKGNWNINQVFIPVWDGNYPI